MKGYLLFLIIVLLSCTHYSNKSTQRIEVIGYDTVTVKENYYSNGHINERLRYKKGVKHGISEYYNYDGFLDYTQYYFHGNIEGVFKKYYPKINKIRSIDYLINDSISVYFRKLDTSGQILVEKGSPYIGYTKIKNKDSFLLTIFFCDFDCNKLELKLSPDGFDYRLTELSKSERELVQEAKVKIPEKFVADINYYMRIRCTNNPEKVYYDTLLLK